MNTSVLKALAVILLFLSLSCSHAIAQYYPDEIAFLSTRYTGCDSVIGQRWDSTKKMWDHYNTYTYSTYPDGHIKSAALYNDTMKRSYSNVFFDSKGKLHHTHTYAYINGAGWVRHTSKHYEWDFLGRIGYQYDSMWQGSSGLQPAYRFNFYHDTLDRRTQLFIYVWDLAWKPSERWDYFYDANGNDTLERVYVWQTAISKYVEESRYRRSYDNLNRIAKLELYAYFGGPDLKLRRRHEYTYDSTGRYIHQLTSYLSGSTLAPGSQDSFFVDKGGMDYRLNYFNPHNGIWDAGSRTFCATTALPAKPLTLDAQLNGVDGGYTVTVSWQDNSNDEDGFVIYRSDDSLHWDTLKIMPKNTTSYIDSTVLADKIYYYRISAFNNFGRGEYSNVDWVETETGVEESELWYKILVYPNPVTDQITIRSGNADVKQIMLTDAAGKMVYYVETLPRGSGTFTIPAGKLTTGIYILSISTKDGVYYQKIIRANAR
jgi:hypothetical protein